jgi:hypothetical protein
VRSRWTEDVEEAAGAGRSSGEQVVKEASGAGRSSGEESGEEAAGAGRSSGDIAAGRRLPARGRALGRSPWGGDCQRG